MPRDMAKGICQLFMDARLIENAADLVSPAFKDRGIYMITPKGLHVLERFITKNGITAQHMMRVFAQQPICMKLLHLERTSADDEIIITKSVVEILWRRFVGRDPNVSSLSEDILVAQKSYRWYQQADTASTDEVDRSIGIVLRRVKSRSSPSDDNEFEYRFPAWSVIEWMCEFSTCVGPDEAAELAAHFVRYGLIALVMDKGRVKEGNIIAEVISGGAGGGAGAAMVSASFSMPLIHEGEGRISCHRKSHLQDYERRDKSCSMARSPVGCYCRSFGDKSHPPQRGFIEYTW